MILVSPVGINVRAAEVVDGACSALLTLVLPLRTPSRPLPVPNVAAVADAVGAEIERLRDIADVVTVRLAT